MKKTITLITFALLAAPAFAKQDCEELRDRIAAKLEAKKVASYTLEIVDPKDVKGRRVVGTCELGTKKIVYTRD